jgi:hypothetical protein
MSEAVEHLLVEAFIAQLAVERLHEAVLLRLARRDVVPGDTGPVLPFQDRPAGQFRAVVRHDGLRPAVEPDAAIQQAGRAGT